MKHIEKILFTYKYYKIHPIQRWIPNMTFQLTEESYFIFSYKQKMAFHIVNESFIRIFSQQIGFFKKKKREKKKDKLILDSVIVWKDK